MISDLTAIQLIAGIARMLLSIGWMYALVVASRAGNRLSAAATGAMMRHIERIGPENERPSAKAPTTRRIRSACGPLDLLGVNRSIALHFGGKHMSRIAGVLTSVAMLLCFQSAAASAENVSDISQAPLDLVWSVFVGSVFVDGSDKPLGLTTIKRVAPDTVEMAQEGGTPEVMKLKEINRCVFRIEGARTGFPEGTLLMMDASKGLNWTTSMVESREGISMIQVASRGDFYTVASDGSAAPLPQTVVTSRGTVEQYEADLVQLRKICAQ